MSEPTTAPVRIGITGLGNRGSRHLELCAAMDDVAVTAVCDVQPRHRRSAKRRVREAGGTAPDAYEDHGRMVEDADLDGLVVATPWRHHVPMAIEAMEAGVSPATDVGPANTVEECWELVRTAERTGQHCMLLENCCYKRHTMAVLRMVRAGLFGELVHCQCGYLHDLREQLVAGKDSSLDVGDGRFFRGVNHEQRDGDLYPTHGVGPVAKYLEINRGNRFVSLTATASKARGLADWAAENLAPDHPARETDWTEGDITTTVLRCAGDETVLINHDTSLPRPTNSKMYHVQGTDGLWKEELDAVYVEGRSPDHEWEAFGPYQAEYEHPVWETYREEGVRGGHGGSDYLVVRAYVDALKAGTRPPIDVYDTAAWMAISPLSEQSVALGNEPVSFPDFTNGAWMNEEPVFGHADAL